MVMRPVLMRRGCNLADQGVVVLAGVSVLGLHRPAPKSLDIYTECQSPLGKVCRK